MIKVCSTCKEIKPVAEFARHTRSKDGLRGQCRKCREDYVKVWRENNIDAVRATARKYASKNKQKRGDYIREARTGFTPDHFKAKLAEQNDLCAICEVPFMLVPQKGVHADHDHRTNKTRGILCRDCNRGLGGFSDSPEVVDRAAAYLRRYSGVEDQPSYAELQRQLAEVTKERDQLRAMLNLADALRNKERNSKC